MARVSATASIGVKLKFFSDYENVSPHASITIERDDYPDDLSDEELVQEASKLYKKCRKYVEDEINSDIKSAKGEKAKIGS